MIVPIVLFVVLWGGCSKEPGADFAGARRLAEDVADFDAATLPSDRDVNEWLLGTRANNARKKRDGSN